MNEIHSEKTNDLLGYQTGRLQALIQETIRCCEERKAYETRTFGLPQAELRCLKLFEGQRCHTVKALAQHLDVAKSRVTIILSGLRRKGLAAHARDPKDGRVKLISLTAAGHEKLEEVLAAQKEIHTRLLLQIDEMGRKDVISCLEVLRTAMEAVKGE